MGVACLRHVLRPLLASLLLAAGSAQAETICLSGSDLCNEPLPAPERVVGLDVRLPELAPGEISVVEWSDFDVGHGQGIFGRDHAEHRWTRADAMDFVHEWARRHRDDDFEEFRRHWHRNHDGHHGGGGGGDGGCDDDDLPKPVPLPGAALLFAPALLMLRAVQRRNA